MELIKFLSYYTGLPIQLLIISLFFIYFSPIIIQLKYRGFTPGLFIANIFLGRTPIPWIILILNVIETNKGNDEINDGIDQIIETNNKIISKFKP